MSSWCSGNENDSQLNNEPNSKTIYSLRHLFFIQEAFILHITNIVFSLSFK